MAEELELARLPEPITKAALLALPRRKWDAESVYDYIYIVPTGKKHDSGYGLIAIIGALRGEAHQTGQIAAICDDVCWTFPIRHPYGTIRPGVNRMILRTDCEYPSGILRMWASSEHYFDGRFRVGASLSSTDVELIVEPLGEPAKLADALARVVA